MIQKRVSDAIWPWREEEKGKGVSGARRWTRPLVESAVMLAFGLIIAFVFGKRWFGAVIVCLAVLVFVSGLFVPAVYAAFRRLGELSSRVVGTGLTWVLLAPFFYICFTPARLFRVLTRKDPLERKFIPGSRKSYWNPLRDVSDPKRYERQY